MVPPLPDLVALAAVLLLFEGWRRFSAGDRTRRTRWIIALGSSLCVIAGAGYFAYGDWLEKLVALNDSPAFQTPANPKGLPNVPLNQLEQFTSRDAALTFQTSGVLLKYYDQRSDTWREWHPSQLQLADREEVVTVRTVLRTRSHQLFWGAYAIWLSGAITAVVGWRVGRAARGA
jgi:hypothetical protein